MRTKLSLCFLLFFGVLESLAQTSERQSFSFRNSAGNRYGLKDVAGNVVQDAEFEDVRPVYIETDQTTRFFWIVKKNDRYGALDTDGKLLVPCQFDRVELSRYGCFVVRNSNRISIYSLSGTEQYSGEGLENIEPVPAGFVLTKNQQQGFLDLQFVERIPFDFRHVEPGILSENADSRIKEYAYAVFQVFRGSNTGIFDLRKGMIIPCNYEYIDIHWANRDCNESAAVYTAFRDNRKFIYNPEGLLVDSVEIHSYPNYYFIPLDSCASKADVICFMADYDQEGQRRGEKMVNLKTGEQFRDYELAFANGNRILCKTGNQWSVIDEHFREVGHWSKWNASWTASLVTTFDAMGNNHLWTPHFEPTNPESVWDNQVVIIYSNPSKHSKYLGFGLYHYEKGRNTPTDYYRIRRADFQGKPVYWAFKLNKEDREQVSKEREMEWSQLDIYDEHLNRIRSFSGKGELPKFEYAFTDRDLVKWSFKKYLYLQKTGTFYGAVNAKGEQVIPAKYKNYRQVVFPTASEEQEEEVYYLFGTDELLGVFDKTGKQLIPEQHPRYMTWNGLFIADNAGIKTRTAYNKQGQKLLEDLDYYFNAYTGKCLKESPDSSLNLAFFMKKDQLFYLKGNTLLLVGPETFEFTSAYLRINSILIIDQQGKVVNTTGMKLSEWNSGTPLELENIPLEKSWK